MNIYDFIPNKYLKNFKIFEVGTGIGDKQINSRNQEIFIKENYTGLDIKDRRKFLKDCDFYESSIIDFQFKRNYDVILMMEVLEHIPISNYPEILSKLTNHTKKFLIFSFPYQERLRDNLETEFFTRKDKYQCHVTYNLDEEILGYFIDESKVHLLYKKVLIKEHKTGNKLKDILRDIKRKMIRHPYTRKSTVLLIYEKSEK
jgi:hypothetical protein